MYSNNNIYINNSLFIFFSLINFGYVGKLCLVYFRKEKALIESKLKENILKFVIRFPLLRKIIKISV